MNIQEAKQEIIHTLQAYLRKDDAGNYLFPAVHQRPILLMGPPGIGKTAIMEQVARRCGVGLARCGSYWGHGSGDIAIAFSTAHDLGREEPAAIRTLNVLREDCLDPVFLAAAEASEESVLNALAAAVTTTGWDGTTVHALNEFADLL